MLRPERRSFIQTAAAMLGVAVTDAAPARSQRRVSVPAGRVRRVVTGHDSSGRSTFITDADAPNVYRRTAESVVITELWETNAAPASNAGRDDAANRPLKLHPPARGSIFRTIVFGPQEQQDAALAKQVDAGDDGTGIVTALRKGASSRAPGFHKTNTTDYVIVISGEIHALMDEGEVVLRAGDVMIQRGTNHAWVNRSNEPAHLAFVLIDAEPMT